MAKANRKPGPKEQLWIDARKKHRLSHVHIQMARELGLNPKKFGNYDNHKQQGWKLPLAEFIEELYYDRFKRERPLEVVSVEEKFRKDEEKKARKRAAKAAKRKVAVKEQDELDIELPEDIPF